MVTTTIRRTEKSKMFSNATFLPSSCESQSQSAPIRPMCPQTDKLPAPWLLPVKLLATRAARGAHKTNRTATNPRAREGIKQSKVVKEQNLLTINETCAFQPGTQANSARGQERLTRRQRCEVRIRCWSWARSTRPCGLFFLFLGL